MNKFIICTVGASLLINIGLPKDWVYANNDKDSPLSAEFESLFEKNLNEYIRSYSESESDRRKLSAELNSLDRIGIGVDDKVALLTSDTRQGFLSADGVKKALHKWYGLDEKNIILRTIDGLNPNRPSTEFRQGLRELVACASQLIHDNKYAYDVILSPLGGYKSTVPFITVLGMLFGLKSVYIFENSNNLMYLPPLPITLNYEMFERAQPALKYIEDVEKDNRWVNKYDYLQHITDYADSEEQLFLSYVEFLEDDIVTISPLAYALIAVTENAPKTVKILDVKTNTLKNDKDEAAKVIRQTMKKLANPLWRDAHLHSFSGTDLTVIKIPSTAERISGFVKDNIFYVTHYFKDHNEYERELSGEKKNSYIDKEFVDWNEPE